MFSKNQVYKPKLYLYQYNDNDFRFVRLKACREKGFEEINKQDTFIPKTESEEVQRVSLSRTKKNIREIALCNNFTYFATITINSQFCDRFSLQACQDLLKKKLKKIKRYNKDFAYIFITEKHKDGAFHFHGLVRDLPLYKNLFGYFSSSVFDEIGFNSFSLIRDYSKCCNYITKYITKDCVKNENNQIYVCSRGLKKATRFELPLDIQFVEKYSNDFCSLADFNLFNEKDKEYVLTVYNLNNIIK